jgi:hypothetical protein
MPQPNLWQSSGLMVLSAGLMVLSVEQKTQLAEMMWAIVV